MIEAFSSLEFWTGLAWGALAADTVKKLIKLRLNTNGNEGS